MAARLLSFTIVALIAAHPYAQDPAPITVLTWNIRYDNPADSLDRWDNRKAALAAEVLERDAALIGLQEALAQQVAYLDAAWPGYKRYGVGAMTGKRRVNSARCITTAHGSHC